MVPPAPTPLTVSVWQGPAVSLDVPANVATCLQVVRDAAHQGAHILVFPELFLSGYCGAPVDMHRAALTVASVEMQAIGNAAKEGSIAVAVGYPERAADGRVFNSCAVWNCHGTLVRSYRKVNLWGEWEASTFAMGDASQLRAVDLTLRGGQSLKIGVLICYDLEFPEPSRCLAMDGAALLIAPTALGMGEVALVTPHCVVPTRANENHVFVLYSNLEGPQNAGSGAPFCGSSAIVGPNGRVLGRAPTQSKSKMGTLLIESIEVGGPEHTTSVARNPYIKEVKARLSDGFYEQYHTAKY